VALAFLPSIAYLLVIKLGNPAWIAPAQHAALYAAGDGHGLADLAAIVTLGNGFIITAMLWGTALVAMIDGHVRRAAGVLLLAAALTLFGFIHSVDPRGGIYLPWTLEGLPKLIAWQFAAAYAALATLLALLSLQKAPTGTAD
jgi:AGZA family xanthine/uracil permease-like MFS transporter